MTKKELKLFNGQNGAKAFIAYKGIVYDVTNSYLWSNGEHRGMHSAGEDLTDMLDAAPHGHGVFSDLKVVGTLEDDTDD